MRSRSAAIKSIANVIMFVESEGECTAALVVNEKAGEKTLDTEASGAHSHSDSLPSVSYLFCRLTN